MAISEFGLNTGQNTSGATLAIGSLSTASGNCIVALVVERNATGATGTVTDTPGNTYVLSASYPLDGSTANGVVQLFTAKSNLTLSSGTITYTKAVSGTKVAMSLFYLTGCDTTAPVRTSATTKADYTASTSPVATISGIQTTDFVLEFCGGDGTGGSFLQDSFFTGINSQVSTGNLSSDARINAGYLSPSAATSVTVGPSFGSNATGTMMLAAFITPGTAGGGSGSFFPFLG